MRAPGPTRSQAVGCVPPRGGSQSTPGGTLAPPPSRPLVWNLASGNWELLMRPAPVLVLSPQGGTRTRSPPPNSQPSHANPSLRVGVGVRVRSTPGEGTRAYKVAGCRPRAPTRRFTIHAGWNTCPTPFTSIGLESGIWRLETPHAARTRTRTQPAGRYSYSIPTTKLPTLTRQPIAPSRSRSTSTLYAG